MSRRQGLCLFHEAKGRNLGSEIIQAGLSLGLVLEPWPWDSEGEGERKGAGLGLPDRKVTQDWVSKARVLSPS